MKSKIAAASEDLERFTLSVSTPLCWCCCSKQIFATTKSRHPSPLITSHSVSFVWNHLSAVQVWMPCWRVRKLFAYGNSGDVMAVRGMGRGGGHQGLASRLMKMHVLSLPSTCSRGENTVNLVWQWASSSSSNEERPQSSGYFVTMGAEQEGLEEEREIVHSRKIRDASFSFSFLSFFTVVGKILSALQWSLFLVFEQKGILIPTPVSLTERGKKWS